MELIEIILYVALPILAILNVVTLIATFVLLSRVKEQSKVECCKEKTVISEPVATPVVEQKREENVAVATDDTVTFSSEKTLTIDDKYVELSDEQKKYYDEIVAYAVGIEGARRFKNIRYEEYKVGKNRLVRMLVKRGITVCEFILPNNDFKNYVSENKLKIKSAPTVLKIVDAETVKIAKDSIDIAKKAIEEEKEFKRQQSKERRKQARQAKK